VTGTLGRMPGGQARVSPRGDAGPSGREWLGKHSAYVDAKGNLAMSPTTSGAQPNDFSEMSGIQQHQWVSDLLRFAAEADSGRRRIAATLAAGDLRRIWRWTEHRTTQRDRRTHQVCCQELALRGVLDEITGLVPRQAPDAT
jgi:hypothetical protein